ncbi:hypothetical protein B0H16DRAFT_1713323 [Mycena metata]|uniref:RING-type E3 ubiquitin transferase n=1 Tax=Mycena metata TaxID=1033252 RepID=A0AAD7JZ82_9AGAR|nr:hypothetical protein B0H16DRAFT_1713323 [Mycena metata]
MSDDASFYNDWEGKDWWPIDADDGSEVQPHDLELWVYCREHGAPPAPSQEMSEDEIKACECIVCADTLFMPVVTLCMHVFCYSCLRDWFTVGGQVCPICRQQVDETPIRDNALEMSIADAIDSGAVQKSDKQPGANVAAADQLYDWEAFYFAGET